MQAYRFYILLITFLFSIDAFYAQWYYQNPVFKSFSSVEFINKTTGFAISDSLIYMTTDGGYSWNKANKATPDTYFSIQFTDSLNGYVLAARHILKTTDGGLNWKVTQIPDFGFNYVLFGMYFLNEQHGYLCGHRMEMTALGTPPVYFSLLIETTDGGKTFNRAMDDIKDNGFIRIYFSGYYSYIISSYGNIFKSTDMWKSYKKLIVPGPAFYQMRFLDSLNGIALSSNLLIKTSDGGTTWDTITPPTGYLAKMDYSSSLIVVACHEPNLYISKDSGNTWQKSTDNYYLQGGCNFVKIIDSSAIVAGAGNHILRSIDCGNSWNDSYFTITARFYSGAFISNSTGIAVGTNVIAKTTNAGKNWKVIFEPDAAFRSVSFNDSLHCYAAGFNGKVFRSKNLGENWEELNFNKITDFKRVFFHKNIGFVAGENGVVFKTSDYGTTWKKLEQFTTKTINGIAWIDSSIYVLGTSGKSIFRTSNSGESWTEISLGNSEAILAVTRLNSNNVVACGTQKFLMKSTDKGISWFNLPIDDLNADAYISGVTFSDSLNGYLCLWDGGIIEHTTNGGLSWNREFTGGQLQDIIAVDKNNAYAFGDIGLILGNQNYFVMGTQNSSVKTSNSGNSLYANFPNPFNPTTKIKYSIGSESKVILTVFNSLGQKINVLVNDFKPAGNYEVIFNANGLPAGVYFYELKAGSFKQVKKLLLLK